MAKKKATSDKKTGKPALSELLKGLQKVVPKASLKEDMETFKIKNYVDMGHYLLNAQISGSIFKGLPEGRMLLLAGDPGTGKTFLALNACRQAQRQYDSDVIWLDSEAAMDPDTMAKVGVNTEKATIQDVDTIRYTAQFILNLLDNVDPDNGSCQYIIVLDSIGNLTSEKEAEDMKKMNVKRDMTKQQDLKALFRTLLNELRRKKVPMIVTSHVYSTMDMYKPDAISGGSGSQYGASITLKLSKAKLKKEDDDTAGDDVEAKQQTGVIIRSTQDKARFTQGGIPITVPVKFKGGINKYAGLRKFLDWDTCGVGPGKVTVDKTGEIHFEPHEGAQASRTWGIKALGKHVKTKELSRYNKAIYTQEVLEAIDAKVRPIFEFPDNDSGLEDDELDSFE